MTEAKSRRPIVLVPTTNPKFENGLVGAKEFGDLVELPKINPFKTHEAITVISTLMRERDFGEDDFIAITGGTILVTLVVLIAYERNEHVRLLFFDAVNEAYVQRSFSPLTLMQGVAQ